MAKRWMYTGSETVITSIEKISHIVQVHHMHPLPLALKLLVLGHQMLLFLCFHFVLLPLPVLPALPALPTMPSMPAAFQNTWFKCGNLSNLDFRETYLHEQASIENANIQ